MKRHGYTVVCLARHGIGPEVMGGASRALTAVSLQHGFHVDERHVPFGADALTRFGRSFPLSSRTVLVQRSSAPALRMRFILGHLQFHQCLLRKLRPALLTPQEFRRQSLQPDQRWSTSSPLPAGHENSIVRSLH